VPIRKNKKNKFILPFELLTVTRKAVNYRPVNKEGLLGCAVVRSECTLRHTWNGIKTKL